MNPDEITRVIKEAFPQLSETIKRKGAINNIYTLMAAFTSFTKEKLALHDLKNTIRSIKLMDKLYSRGDHILRNAIESIFIFSFSQMRGNCTPRNGKQFRRLYHLHYTVSIYGKFTRAVTKIRHSTQSKIYPMLLTFILTLAGILCFWLFDKSIYLFDKI